MRFIAAFANLQPVSGLCKNKVAATICLGAAGQSARFAESVIWFSLIFGSCASHDHV